MIKLLEKMTTLLGNSCLSESDYLLIALIIEHVLNQLSN